MLGKQVGIKTKCRRKKANFLGSQMNPFRVWDLDLKKVKDSFRDNSQRVVTLGMKGQYEVHLKVVRVNLRNVIIVVDFIQNNAKKGYQFVIIVDSLVILKEITLCQIKVGVLLKNHSNRIFKGIMVSIKDNKGLNLDRGLM